ncbi:hypothetical protein [Cesiribacter andamanensis]|nr:hypothetical protein [Cesiribacter andamanensis]
MRLLPILMLLLTGCSAEQDIQAWGRQYRQQQDYQSLKQVVARFPAGADTAYLSRLLGDPINMGFDYHYLVDSTGPDGCPVGAVFHISPEGTIDHWWLDQICE